MNSCLHNSGYLKLFEYSRKGTLKSIPKLLVLKKRKQKNSWEHQMLKGIKFSG